MIDRDQLLQRVMHANPYPSDQELHEDLADSAPPLSILIADPSGAPSDDGEARTPQWLPDLDDLPEAEEGPTSSPQTWETESRRRPLTVGLVAVAAAFAVVVATVAVLGSVGGVEWFSTPEVPTLHFDGETATYEGPETFETNLITFRLESAAEGMIGFGWGLTRDDSITFEQDVEWNETHRGGTYEIAPWTDEWGGMTDVFIQSPYDLEVTVAIPDGNVLLYVWVPRDRILYPAAQIRVEGGMESAPK